MQNVLSILFCLTLFYLVVALRLKAYVSVLRMQGILLTAIIVFPFINNLSIHVVIIPVLFFAIKVILIPKYINRVIDNIDIDRIIKPTIQQINFLLLVICSVILIFVASSLLPKNTDLDIITIASGFSAILTGIYVIIFRKTLIVHVVEYSCLAHLWRQSSR
jgi:hydrogenase-4 component E